MTHNGTVRILLTALALQSVIGCASRHAENTSPMARATEASLTGEYYGFPLPFVVNLQIIKSKSPLRRDLEPVTSYLASKIAESGVPRQRVRSRIRSAFRENRAAISSSLRAIRVFQSCRAHTGSARVGRRYRTDRRSRAERPRQGEHPAGLRRSEGSKRTVLRLLRPRRR